MKKGILIYTTHKAGSTFVHKLSRSLSEAFNIPYHSIYDDANCKEIVAGSWKQFIEKHSNEMGCFGPIRSGTGEPIFPDHLEDYSVVLHLRDPRDVLTSLYYSHTYSHSRREGGFNPSDETRKSWLEAGVDDYVCRNMDAFVRRYRILTSNLLGRENVIHVSYEEMVSNYAAWLARFLSAFSHVPAPRNILNQVLRPSSPHARIYAQMYKKYKNEFTPPLIEDVRKHKRQIVPGDYRRKLDANTIALLNMEFGELLHLLNY